MGVLLRGGCRRWCCLRGGFPLHSPPNLTQECTLRHPLSANHGQAKTASGMGSSSFRSEATPDILAINVQAHMGSSYKASAEFFSMKSWQQKVLSTGVEGKDLRWTGWRAFSSLQDHQLSTQDLSGTRELREVDTNSLSSKSDEDFDFRNFPALTSSYYENYQRPSVMEVRKKRAILQNKSKNADKKLTLNSIPKPRGRTYDFGLGNKDIKPPPLEAGARPQGGFDIDLSFDEGETDAYEGSPDLR